MRGSVTKFNFVTLLIFCLLLIRKNSIIKVVLFWGEQLFTKGKISMKVRSLKRKRIVAFLMSILVMSSVIIPAISSFAYDEKKATIDGSVVNVRSEASTSASVVTKLTDGTTVTVIGEKDASDGYTWYQIKVTVSGATKKGWVRGDLLDIKEEIKTDADFEAYLTKQKFPESYKVELRKLHAKYPDWIFEAQHTGLKWATVIKEENVLGRSLIHNSSISSWKSTQTGAYDWDTGEWIELDSGGWVAASEDLIEYYMDPRNFLDETNVFQFLEQKYDGTLQTTSGMKNVVKGTFLANTYEEGGKDVAYTTTIMNAGKSAGVSPYVLASMIIIEQGTNGAGNSISGTVSGYKGYYNYFNIGAYKTSTMTAVQRGLWFAKGSGVGATSYDRPWNTRTKSITGGAKYYAEGYVDAGQDTLYLKKFNVQGKEPYTHQYMTNVGGAAGEGAKLANAFSTTARKAALTFKIPVYTSMPSKACAKPTVSGSPNYMLKTLKVTGYSLSPTFDKYTTAYSLIVPSNVSSVKITASAIDSKAKISGTGTVTLATGSNKKSIKVTAENGSTRTYTITIVREKGDGAPDPTMTSKTYTVDAKAKTISGIKSFPVKASTFKNKLTITDGSVKLLTSDGKTQKGNVGTGTQVKLYNEDGDAVATYKVILYGDTNGDGDVNALDLLRVQKAILGVSKLTGNNKTAADTSRNGNIDALDLLQVQKQIIGKGTIKQ